MTFVNIYCRLHGFDLTKYRKTVEVRKVLRNCVEPEIGKYIFEQITGGVNVLYTGRSLTLDR